MQAAFVEECLAVLSRTPATLDAMLRGLPDVWTQATEGGATWSPYYVVGHMIHGERADWIPRAEIILAHGTARPFDPFDRDAQFLDRDAQFRESAGKSLAALLDEFGALRTNNLQRLRALKLTPEHLELRGTHPALGSVTMRQLLATWTAHDLGHLVQISRTMARRYRTEVGPWAEYLSVMRPASTQP